MTASMGGNLEILHVLLGLSSAKASINHHDDFHRTALWYACYNGHGGVVTALLGIGADPTIANAEGTTPMAIAKQAPLPQGTTAEGYQECVAALEVSRSPLFPGPSTRSYDQLADKWPLVPGVVGRRRSGPTSSGRPGRWPMRLRASRRRRWWRGGLEARSSVGAWRQCRRS
jgi:hypothetical protein